MKRDLKKWLRGKELYDYLQDFSDSFVSEDKQTLLSEEDLIQEFLDCRTTDEEKLNFLWAQAQKRFLKDILDDIDVGIEKMFNGKDSVKNDKARLVVYESQLKAWLHGKYKYLQRKNGE